MLASLGAAAEPMFKFEIPEGKTPAELVVSVQRQLDANKPSPSVSTEVADKFVREVSPFLRDAGTKILGMNPSPAILQDAYMMKFQGLEHLAMLGDKDSITAVESLIDEIETKLPGSQIAKLTRTTDLERKVTVFVEKEPTANNFERLVGEARKLIAQEPQTYLPYVSLVFVNVAVIAEEKLQQKGLAKKTCEQLLETLKGTKNVQMQPIVKQLEGITRRMDMLGKEFKLEGFTVDGEKFDIQSFRGKVVLVDFFFSTCLPCIEELPELKRAYEKYKANGFEIVSVGIQDPTSLLKQFAVTHKLPWTVISDELTMRRRMEGIAIHYDVHTVPTMFLLDREGKVIDPDARGPSLVRSLEKIFSEEAKK